MKKIFFLLIIVCLNHVVSAEFITGTVINAQTDKPLIGATIYIPDLKKGAVTDAEGHYEIKGLPAGKYLLEVRYAGFTTIAEKVLIHDHTQKNWILSPAVIEGNEVVITGVSKATEVQKQPSHISVLSHLQLQQITTDNIIGKIAELPGVSAITTGPDVMKPVIRGLSANRIVVVNNGIRQEGQQWGDEHGIEIDSYSAGTIEVLRGASSLMYGSDALGGVVQILPPKPAFEGHITGNLIANYQANNGLIAYHGDVKGNKNGFTWHIYGTGKLAHDYKNKYDGYVFNSKFREANFGAGIGINKQWGYSHLSFSSYDLHLGLPEGERDSATGKFLKETALNDSTAIEVLATQDDFMKYHPYIPRQRVQHRKITWDNKLRMGMSDLKATFAYQQNRRREYEDILAPDEPGLFLKLNTFNYNAHYSLPEISGWNTTFGTNGMTQTNKNGGDEFLIPTYNLLDIGIFGITQKTVHRLTITGGLRYDARWIHSKALMKEGKLHFKAFNKNFSSLSGSAGVSWRAMQHLVLKANIARGFRAPSIPELAANGVHEGTLRYETGNTNLKPEISSEFDAGAEFNNRHISASLYAYYNSIQHYIYSRKLLAASAADSVHHTDEGDFKVFQYQQTNAHLYGLEAAVDIHPHPLDWLHFKNTFSYVRGIRVNGTDSTRDLPRIPAGRLITELGFNFPHTGHTFQKIFLNIELNNTFAQNHFLSAYRTETATPGYTLLNIEAGTDVVNKNKKTIFSFYFSVKNLANVAYQDHLSRLKYLPVNYVTGRQGIFNMGRNFSFKVVVPFVL